MAWWAWLLLPLSFLFLLSALILLQPLRIFMRYLRENKKDQISLKVKLGFLSLRLELCRGMAAGGRYNWRLTAGKIEMPAGLLHRAAGRMEWPRNLLDIKDPLSILTVIRQAGRLMKGITWSHFDLEISWGWDDPALTGLAAGSCWALGGILTGLLHEYFSVAAHPRLQVRPHFGPAEFFLRWEGEAAITLYRWLRLWFMVKKIGGAKSGTSSH